MQGRLLPRVLSLFASLVLAGCGNSVSSTTSGEKQDSSAPAVVQAAADCISGASSVHLVAATHTGSTQATFDVRITNHAELTGTASLGTATASVVATHRTAYARGKEMWRRQGGDRVADFVGDNWVSAAEDDAVADFPFASGLFFDFPGLAHNVESFASARTVGRGITPDGRPALKLDGKNGTLYVSPDAGHCPLYIANQRDATLHTAFSDLNRPVVVSAPADAIPFKDVQAVVQAGETPEG